MNKVSWSFWSLLVGASFALAIAEVDSFEVDTHRALTTTAVRSSKLDDFLKSQIALSQGVDHLIDGQRVIQWIEEGSVREDDGLRFFNHFHNPLRIWDQAGLRIFGGQLGRSSILWAQDAAQGFAWQNTRDSYFNALTATDQDTRNRYFADTFRALGQLIHFVQDAAVPAHTRNDQHLLFEGFERYANSIQGTPIFNELTAGPQGFAPSILDLPENSLAPIPIARITDSTDPEQAEVFPDAGTAQGMAEYSNANFLSGDTIFTDFAFPRLQSIDLANPVRVNNRNYYRKTNDGEAGFLLAAEGSFTERLLSLSSQDPGFILDRLVYEQYASRLLPRAVGYSAGLIDYFFRGEIAALAADVGCFWPQFPPPPEFQISLSNISPPGEETAQGEMFFVVHYKVDGESHWFSLPIVTVNLDRETIWITYSGTALDQVPANATDTYFLAVYKGPLSNESQAVVVSRGEFAGLC